LEDIPEAAANLSNSTPPLLTALFILVRTLDIAEPPASALIPTEAIAADKPIISFCPIPATVAEPAKRCEKSMIFPSSAAILFNFVIVKAFYPLLLYLSIKFGIHFQLKELSDTLGGIIALLTLNLYALRYYLIYSYLGISLFNILYNSSFIFCLYVIYIKSILFSLQKSSFILSFFFFCFLFFF